MYRGHYIIEVDEQTISKLEKILKDKWKATDIIIKKFPNCWEIHFSTEDYKKVFQLKEIIKTYKGKVLYQWIK